MLAENCREFRMNPEGKVIGVQLGITPVPGSKYEVYRVELVDETKSNDNTVASCYVLDSNGIDTRFPATLGWPGQGPTFSNSLLPGNPNNQHVISNGYVPPKVGPLSIFVGPKEAPTSDIVYGFGLPLNRHVSYTVIFRERGSIVVPPDPTDPPTGDLTSRVIELEKWRKSVTDFFGGREG